MILFVGLEMLSQFADTLTQNCDLDFGGTGVLLWVRKRSIRVVFLAVASTAVLLLLRSQSTLKCLDRDYHE